MKPEKQDYEAAYRFASYTGLHAHGTGSDAIGEAYAHGHAAGRAAEQAKLAKARDMLRELLAEAEAYLPKGGEWDGEEVESVCPWCEARTNMRSREPHDAKCEVLRVRAFLVGDDSGEEQGTVEVSRVSAGLAAALSLDVASEEGPGAIPDILEGEGEGRKGEARASNASGGMGTAATTVGGYAGGGPLSRQRRAGGGQQPTQATGAGTLSLCEHG